MAGDADITDVSPHKRQKVQFCWLITRAEANFLLTFSLCACVNQFDNLILDETTIESLTTDDRTYLEQFAKLELISLN